MNIENVFRIVIGHIMALRIPHGLISPQVANQTVTLFGHGIFASAVLLFARTFVSEGSIGGSEYLKIWFLVAGVIAVSGLLSMRKVGRNTAVDRLILDAKKIWYLFIISFYAVLSICGLVLFLSSILNFDLMGFFDDMSPVQSPFIAYFLFSFFVSLLVMYLIMSLTRKMIQGYWQSISNYKYLWYLFYSAFSALLAALALSF